MAVNKNIIWKGQAHRSLENCALTVSKDGMEASSVIIGQQGGVTYRVEYFIRTNKNWETVVFQIKSTLNGWAQSFAFESADRLQMFRVNGALSTGSVSCDVDISLTPFTNTLPVNRLHLQQNETKEICVLYVDVLSQEIKWVQQSYTRISKFQYKYQNVPNDFEAIITVDAYGLVVHYPGLFERTAIN